MLNTANITKTLVRSLFIFCFVCMSLLTTFAAGEVDPTFNPVPSRGLTLQDSYGNLEIQPDGKIIIFGQYSVVNGTAKNGIARLNQDGSFDNTFNCAACNFSVRGVKIQLDGKIIVAGTANEASRLIRINSNGSLDASFASPINGRTGFFRIADVLAIQSDGKIFVSERISGVMVSGIELYKLNADGSFDNSFTPLSFDYRAGERLNELKLLPNGKFLIGGLYDYGYLFRVNPDGTKDNSFETPTLTWNQPSQNPSISSFDFQADGKIVFTGEFVTVNGLARNGTARLNADGSVDTGFTSNGSGSQLKVLSSGKILLGSTNIIRLNSDGTIDNTFNDIGTFSRSWELDSTERIVSFSSFNENNVQTFKYARFDVNGNLDPAFNVRIEGAGTVYALALQTDGKLIVSGEFERLNGIVRRKLARLNTDGTVDTTLETGSGFNFFVVDILVQPDGKMLVAGDFTEYNGTPRAYLARLNADGSLDNGFNPTIGSPVLTIALQPDGKILIGGSFNNVNNAFRTGIARLNSDGTLDAGFNVTMSSPTIRNIVVESDGKIVIGGGFNSVNGFSRSSIARLNIDGSLDNSFNAGNNLDGVHHIERQPDGKYIVVNNSQHTIRRLNNDGSADNTFQTRSFGTVNIRAILLLPDGSIIVGGNFQANVPNIPRSHLTRLKPNGAIDLSFFPNGANNTVWAIAKQADGKVIIGGEFTVVENVARIGLARLIAAPIVNLAPLFDFDGDARADIAVYRPSNQFWYRLNSGNGQFEQAQFGQANSQIVPADYDGDGKTDLAYYRQSAATDATFHITNSSNGTLRQEQFGSSGDVPVPGDWDGDGTIDLAVYRAGAGGGQSYFFYRPSSQPGVNFISVPWGVTGDKPMRGDFDGDGKQDAAVFRPSISAWLILNSSNNQFLGLAFGQAGDVPTPADFDGDGRTDIAVYRPSTGGWYRINSTTGGFFGLTFGIAEDVPVAADYDGDSKADAAVWRPSTGTWYLLRSTQGFLGIQWGANGDKPIPSAYNQ